MSKVLVTGGAGFIGSHLTEALIQAGHHVRVVDNLSSGNESNLSGVNSNKNFEFRRIDITKDPLLNVFKGVERVNHLAALADIVPSIEQPVDYMSVNVQGTVRVLEGARAAGIEKFVYAASSSCYGLADVPTREDHPVRPQYPYALSKYQGEQAVFHWHKVYGLPANSIRIFNAYGTRVRTTGAYGAVFGVFLKQKLAGKPFTIVGDGTQSRDFLYATDVARAFWAAAETDCFTCAGGNSLMILSQFIDLAGIGNHEIG